MKNSIFVNSWARRDLGIDVHESKSVKGNINYGKNQGKNRDKQSRFDVSNVTRGGLYNCNSQFDSAIEAQGTQNWNYE